MEQASLVYLDLLDGIDKPVAGSTCAFTLIINLFKALTHSCNVLVCHNHEPFMKIV